MIQQLSQHHRKGIACLFFFVFYLSVVIPTYAGGGDHNRIDKNVPSPMPKKIKRNNSFIANNPAKTKQSADTKTYKNFTPQSNKFIGGPSQPEMSSFKSVGVDNMVNLFTGDFSYNIPLLDVGGYPVNIFYNGNPSMEEEASWVGLGWNINPGNVNRNMRGVPDDFNGEDTLVEQQQMKPNITWGGRLSPDLELVGIKLPVDVDLGVSVNNYLGPALELGIKGGLNFNLGQKVVAEKNTGTDTLGFPFKAGVSFSANLNSREGLTLSASGSFTANSFWQNRAASAGLSLGTSYNSRSGIKDLQISEQMSFSKARAKDDKHYGDKNYQQSSSISENILSSSISFSKPSYLPIIRMPLTNSAFSGHFQLGGALFGSYTSGEVEAYFQKAQIEPVNQTQYKPLIGYMYYQDAVNNPNAVMDFSRLNDKEVTGKTPVISAPQYAYDVFAVQGEGTGGTIRAYRNDLGYVRDNSTHSQDKSVGLGIDVGLPGHFGANFNTVKTPSFISEWENGNKLRDAIRFSEGDTLHENVYFRNPGETSVLNENEFSKIGGTDLVRFQLKGTNSSPTIEPVLERFSKDGYNTGSVNIISAPGTTQRKKRTQVISFLTAKEASMAGLDTAINSYNLEFVSNIYRASLNDSNNLNYTTISRAGGYRKEHHISQINITEADGKRYIYGIPVYNKTQQDFTFSVEGANADSNKVNINAAWMTTGSPFINGGQGSPDGYVQITKTPAYAHSFLLSGLLSPDYADVTGDGITEDDLGNAVKFNYTLINQLHKWRTPLSNAAEANLNAGNRSEKKDDKGIVSYGERESWYLHSIESKTMIAVFTLEDRNDGKGPSDSLGGIASADQSLKRLKQIDLFNKADLKANGINNAKPVKTVHFGYSYKLCNKTPDNPTVNNTLGQGKLTLDSIYFTFNGQKRNSKNLYRFSYVANSPDYAFNASDRWGTYKPASKNPGGLKNKDYPYSLQDTSNNNVKKDTINRFASAWALNKILLPSGGQIEVEYESDDYAFVQNRRATDMMQVVGFGSSQNYNARSNRLFDVRVSGNIDNNYVFIRVPQAVTAATVFKTYLEGLIQFAFRYAVFMPKGAEYLTCYADLDTEAGNYYGVTANNTIIWLKLRSIDGYSPLALTALEYLREQLPGQAFDGYDVSESTGIEQVAKLLKGWLSGVKGAFQDPINFFRNGGKTQFADTSKCFVRLNDPDGYKYGGGNRVKSIKLKDNWYAMTSQYTSTYGQTYDYTTTEVFNGAERTISSGVASYEPSIGGEENPFQSIVQVTDKLPLGPTSYGSIEMPMLDAFFPAPSVGYSKVTVHSIQSTDTAGGKKSKSGIGKQVTEFYTAKDFPVYYDNTHFDPTTDRQEHDNSTTAFFYKYAFDSRALSQGFLVETNDMHGKLKSQSSYAANDTNTRINYTENFYRNTGSKGLGEKFDFVYGDKGGLVDTGNMGIDIELMTDTREFAVGTSSLEVQGQLDLFPVVFPFWLPFIWPVSGNSENIYRAVTTTKVINYHSILDSVVVIDKGSTVSTKNLLYDAETGSVIVNRTNNEFDKPVFTTNYPAYWAYSGMGLAYKNIDAKYSQVDFSQGRITSPIDASVFESGDELLILDQQDPAEGSCDAQFKSPNVFRVWVFDTTKNTSSLTATTHYFMFLDSVGKPYTKANVSFRIIRSGKRNTLDANVAGITTMTKPIIVDATDGNKRKLKISDTSKTINASAVEYKEKWQTDNDIFKTYSLVTDANCNSTEVEDCNGYLEKSINPYVKGLLGNFRPDRSFVFYGNRLEKIPVSQTSLPQNGFLDSFKLYWDFNTASNLIPDLSNTKWVWNNQSTKFNARGLELETKNALNIYTAAQYGYDKTLPVAITNNARYNEAAYDGFEDNNYSYSLHGANTNTSCTNKKFFDFPLIEGMSELVNTDTTNFNAHTGKYVLGVDKNSIATKTFSIATSNSETYSLIFNKDTARSLSDPGGNYQFGPPIDDDLYLQDPTITFNQSSSVTITLDFDVNSERNSYSAETSFDFYIKIPTANTYKFWMYLNTEEYRDNSQCSVYLNGISISIRDSMGGPVTSMSLSQNNISDNIIEDTTSFFLCPGIYRIVGTAYQQYVNTINPQDGYNMYSWKCTNCDSYDYKSLTTQDGCISTQPIIGKDLMLNSSFNIPANKKMLFSTWVREDCSTGPCPPRSYNNSQIQINFNNGSSNNVTLNPIGGVIDGWQKVGGEFTAPEGATTMNLSLVNNSTSRIYFDDLRIQPFNANMKSYVYDPVNLRLVAELDANNYATFYEYDAEGTLIRTKAETQEGIKTINETRSAKQKTITNFQ